MTKPSRLPDALSPPTQLNGAFRSPPSGVCGKRDSAKGRARATRRLSQRLLCQ